MIHFKRSRTYQPYQIGRLRLCAEEKLQSHNRTNFHLHESELWYQPNWVDKLYQLPKTLNSHIKVTNHLSKLTDGILHRLCRWNRSYETRIYSRQTSGTKFSAVADVRKPPFSSSTYVPSATEKGAQQVRWSVIALRVWRSGGRLPGELAAGKTRRLHWLLYGPVCAQNKTFSTLPFNCCWSVVLYLEKGAYPEWIPRAVSS